MRRHRPLLRPPFVALTAFLRPGSRRPKLRQPRGPEFLAPARWPCHRAIVPIGICAQGAAGQSGGSRGVVSFRWRRPKQRNTACPKQSGRRNANTPALRETQGAGGTVA